MLTPRDYQIRQHEAVWEALSGARSVCAQAPTGSGKGLSIAMDIMRARGAGLKVAVMSHRKILTDQLIGIMEEHQIPFGVRSAEHKEYLNHSADIQIVGVQTEKAREKNIRWDRFDPDLLIPDECHLMRKGYAREYFDKQIERGARAIGYTATPIYLAEMFDVLVQGPSLAELRAGGYLLRAEMHDCGAANLDKIEKKRNIDTGEFSANDTRGYVQQIFGSVYSQFKRLNPDGLPSIFFAPGVADSKWLVDQFSDKGVRVAHIDGEDIYLDGEMFKKSRATKDEVFREVEAGKCHVSNRYVMREGVNLTCLYYLSLACPIGSLSSYIQTCGRLLRPYPGYSKVVIADHGGNRLRHLQSPNDDVDWNHLWQFKGPEIERARRMQAQNGEGSDPGFACPGCQLCWKKIPTSGVCNCGHVIRAAYKCPTCGHEHKEWPRNHRCLQCRFDMRGIRRRPILEADGNLQLVPDATFKRDRVKHMPKSEEIWSGKFWGNKRHSKRTFAQAYASANHEHWKRYRAGLPRDLDLMPINEFDWNRRVCDVPMEALRNGAKHVRKSPAYRQQEFPSEQLEKPPF